MSNHIPVLIVGAGPTGLLMACELARHGIKFRIIDKKPEQTSCSNATWIQTRTIEILDHLGIVNRFLKIGHPCNAINLYANGKHLLKLPLDQIDSTYPFILMLPQSETEKLLNEYLKELKNHVERSLEFIEATQKENKVTSTIKHLDGKIETITSNWLIGCGGVGSTVRSTGEFSFPGHDLPEQFLVADAKMSSSLSTNEIHVFFDKGTVFPEKGTILTIAPLGAKTHEASSYKYRITANVYQEGARKTLYSHEAIDIIRERSHGKYTASDVSWISPFWIHSNIIDHMRDRLTFLAGDAAHNHSPVGGQGMNTGLQDAYNLAWKLALVIKEKAKPSLLDSYQSERYPVICKVVKQTEELTNMSLFDKAFSAKLHHFCDKILDDKKLELKIINQIEQLDIRYKESPVIDYHECVSTKSPRQGERAPGVFIDKSTRLYDYLRNAQHNILLFAGLSASNEAIEKIKETQQWLSKTYSDLIKIHIISTSKLEDFKNSIIDVNAAVHKRYGVKDNAIFIIRPDNYIAYCSKSFDTNLIKDFFQKYLI
ncbi:MAG: FAD-dependent monooxygenase [Proteobacteria bacterium]|nr:FAD-dependent monooxygenase [Pseudomonadota bacterium]